METEEARERRDEEIEDKRKKEAGASKGTYAAIHHLKSSPTFSVRPCSSVGRVTVDLFRRSWVRFPPR